MTDPIEIARTAAILLGIIGIVLCIIAWQLIRISRSLKKLTAQTSVELRLPEDTSQMTFSLENIAWAAGRSFQHGMRTDR